MGMTLAAALDDYLASARGASFCWTTNNCGDFISGWVLAATGRPVSAVLHGRSDRATARAVRAEGGLSAVVTKRLHCAPLPPTFAQVGDIVAYTTIGLAGALCICVGRMAVGRDAEGELVFVPLDQAADAWRLSEVAA